MKILQGKKITIIVAAMSMIAILTSCGPTAEDIMKKYDAYGEVGVEQNNSGVSIEQQTMTDASIKYSLPLLNLSKDYIEKLADRWFVADAENPETILPVKVGLIERSTIIYDVAQPITYEHSIYLDDVKTRFLLIGFMGIDSCESEIAETQPLFFLAKNKKGTLTILTDIPRLAGELFTADYEQTRFVTYSTLTVQEIKLNTTHWFELSFNSIVLTDETGTEIIVTDIDKWFENAKTKGDGFKINGQITTSFLGETSIKVELAEDAKMMLDFKIDEKTYSLSIGKGSEFFTEKTPDGKYIFLPEETAKLPSSPIIVKDSGKK
jgi:hypothetical protein